MSNINPSFKEHDALRIYDFIPNQAIQHVVETQETPTTKEDVIHILDKFGKNNSAYTLAKISAMLNSNKNDSVHIFNLFKIFLIRSLEETFPDKDFSKLEQTLEELKKDLDKQIRNDNVDNEKFSSFLAGILRGLI